MNPKVKALYWFLFAACAAVLIGVPTRMVVERLDAIAAAQHSAPTGPQKLGALPSGNGPTDANHSLSTVPATDAGAWPISGTIVVSGTDTANQGTANDGGSPWYIQGSQLGTVATQTGPASAISVSANLSLSTTNATQFASQTATTGWCRVSAPITNTAPINVWDSAITTGATGTGDEILPGGFGGPYHVTNANVLYARTGTATQNVHISCY